MTIHFSDQRVVISLANKVLALFIKIGADKPKSA
jgi:hypothetical protein